MTEHKREVEQSIQLKPVMRFFLYCSASNEGFLKNCSASERYKYTGLGVSVFITALVAVLSGAHAFFYLFNNISVAILLAVFWGLLIFHMHRFIVTTIRKNGRLSGNQRKLLIPQLLLALFLAILISTPLELKIFEQEIVEKAQDRKAQNLQNIESLYEVKIAEKQHQVEKLRQVTQQKQDLVKEYFDAYKCECDGTCGTIVKGVGAECLRKESKYIRAKAEFSLLKTQNQEAIQALMAEIDNLNKERTDHQHELKGSDAATLLVRLEAWRELPLGPSIVMTIMLIGIVIAPMLIALLLPYGRYDQMHKVIKD